MKIIQKNYNNLLLYGDYSNGYLSNMGSDTSMGIPTVTAGVTFTRGDNGNAIAVLPNGTTNYIVYTGYDSTKITSTGTFFAVLKAHQPLAASFEGVISAYAGNGNWVLRITTNKISFRLFKGAGQTILSDGNIPTNVDCTIGVVVNCTTAKARFFINGVFDIERSLTIDSLDNSINSGITVASYPGTDNLNGVLYKALVFNNALTDTEMGELHSQTFNQPFYSNRPITNYRKTDGTTYKCYIDGGLGWQESLAATTAGYLSNTRWIISSGSGSVRQSDATISGGQSTYGEKNIRGSGTTGGYRSESNVYGTYEWYFDRLINNSNYLIFMCEGVGTNGYRIRHNAAGYVTLDEVDSGGSFNPLFTSGIIGNLTGRNYFRVTRSVLGEFAVYISSDGINYTLITADTGSNPVTDVTHTTTNYQVFLISSGNDIGGFRFLERGF